jgi:hypothetical protein
MATRENQGLQIALILFVMITIALFVTTYIYWSKSEQKIAEADAAVQSKAEAEKRYTAYFNAYNLLKRTIGPAQVSDPEYEVFRTQVKSTDPNLWANDLEKIELAFNDDMLLFDANYNGDKNYRTLPGYLLTAIRARNDTIVTHLDYVRSADQEKVTITNRESSQKVAAEDGMQLAVTERDKVKQVFDADRQKFITDTTALQSRLDAALQQAKADADKAGKDKAVLETSLAKLQQLVEAQAAKLAGMNPESTETADGKITWVNQGSRVAYVNIGLADGLRRQTTFSVYNKDQTAFNTARPKGSVEITRIIDGHLSEARIVSDNAANPLMPGDVVFSPTWQPGRIVRFAMVGFIDADGDGKSDRKLVENLISMNGGQVDAFVDEEGKTSGSLSIDTRYLIVGQRPTDKSGAQSLSAYVNMIGESQRLGIEQMSVRDLLDYMGYKGEVKTQTLGKYASPEDFKSGSGSGGAGAGGFAPRQPPAKGNNGAF